MRTLYSLILLCLFGTLPCVAQNGINITYYDGTVQSFNIDAAGKLYFEADNLNVKTEAAAIPTTIPVSIIRKITFANTLGTQSFGDNATNIVLYPNPGSDVVRIKAATAERLKVGIFSMTGQLVLQGNYQSGEEIDVSALHAGLYLVQVNGLTVKFSKK